MTKSMNLSRKAIEQVSQEATTTMIHLWVPVASTTPNRISRTAKRLTTSIASREANWIIQRLMPNQIMGVVSNTEWKILELKGV